MRKMCAIPLLVVTMVLGSSTLSGPSLASVGNEETPGKAVIWSPEDGAVFVNAFPGRVQVDLSNAGATEPHHQFEISYRDKAGVWHLAATISDDDALWDATFEPLGPGSYAVRVDPTWLGDTYTVQHDFTVIASPSLNLTVNDHEGTFPHGQVDVEAHLYFPNRAGEKVRWTVREHASVGGYAAEGTIVAPLGSKNVRLPIQNLPAGDYDVQIYREANPAQEDHDRFTVQPPMEVTDVAAAPRTFYPVRQDGYRDTTTITWRQSAYGQATIHVNRDGAGPMEDPVRLDGIGSRTEAGVHTWTWDGRTRTGEMAPPGTYEVLVHVDDLSNVTGSSTEITRQVTLASGIVTHRRSLERRATNTTARTKTGTCGFRAADRELKLSCTGKGYARATYEYRIPRNAFDVRAGVGGQQHCCSPGQVRIVGKRISPTRYRTTVKVTGRRSYTIAWADLRYKYKVRR